MKLALRRLGHQQFGRQLWETTTRKEKTLIGVKEMLLSFLEQAAQAFMQRLVTDAEPQVWYTCDAEGNSWWHVHDPVSGRSLYDASEIEMRVWLEQRHHPALAN